MSSAQTPRLPPVLAEYPQGVRIRGPERHPTYSKAQPLSLP